MIYILSIAIFSVGIFLILSAVFDAPTAKRAVVIHKILNPKAKPKDNFSDFVDKIAVPLSNVLPMKDYQFSSLKQSLDAANITVPVKLYLCRCIVKSVILFAITAVASIVVKPLLIAAFAMPVYVYFEESKKAENMTLKYRKEIESDLPQLVATLSVQLSSSRDIVRILKAYIPTANHALKKELAITVVDMESGNYEMALSRLETRVNSNLLSDVVRGLLGTVRGNDERTYFQMLGYNLKQLELTNMKKEAQKAVPKLNAASMVLLLGIMILFVGVLLADMMSGMGVLF